ncbi:beta-1,3-glucanase family protein [Longimicrobium sp.]|uniref:beta-1,3-glucanase family protein n=1 Tax=Longimicrobium sp. TaxID=2029185 RepID=UPI003B3B7157
MQASALTGGGALTDTGQASTTATPPLNPLATWFDAPIQAFFARYTAPQPPLSLTATDGTSDGYVYAFQGTTTTDASGLPCLQLVLSAVTQAGVAVAQPPIAVGTPFNVYSPYWNTNTYDDGNPAPPAWAPYPQVPASMMVLAAEGVFADGAQQAASNLPPGVPATSAARYGTLLGSLENQIVAALVRGIATSTLAPENWGNGTAPVQLSPTLVTGTSTLAAGTPYFYVVTAVNGGGETVGSLEFSATPTAADPCVQVNWLPMSTAQAQSFNVYRGTASRGENVLLASVPNTDGVCAYVDGGGAGTPQSPPSYFPADVPSNAYDAFFHQPAVSVNGVAYASPYDDQGGQSSTLSVANPTLVSITLGPWATAGTDEGGAHTAAKPGTRHARG